MKTRTTILPGMHLGAAFSDCERYRYSLWRSWGAYLGEVQAKPRRYANFLMLNPSTADEKQNDPTVERCERRARAMGYDGLFVTNIFALRSTDPNRLYEVEQSPIGEKNDEAILEVAGNADIVICGWGAHGKHMRRGMTVLSMLRFNGIVPHALRITKGGHPGHPLYIGYDVQPKPIRVAA